MLKAAAIASNATGMPIHCHVMEAAYMPQVMQILEVMEVPPSKFVWAHADHEAHLKTILEVVKRGHWVGFDCIKEGTYEAKRQLIEHAILNRYEHQVLLSQDYDFGEESAKENGKARYSAFFNEFLPYCVNGGISAKTIELMITDNPGRFYDVRAF